MNEGDLRKPLNSGSTANFWKRRSVAVAFVFAFNIATWHVSVYACSCGRVGSFIMNRESDDKTLILPRDARGVLWWGVGGDQPAVQKGNFAVRLLSGPRERSLDFRVIEVKPTLFDRPDRETGSREQVPFYSSR
jgi:hypothetical protein